MVVCLIYKLQDGLRPNYTIFNGARPARFGAVLLIENKTVRVVCEHEVQEIFPGWKVKDFCRYRGYSDKHVRKF